MKYIKVVLESRDGCLESNYVIKTVKMIKIVLQAVSRASGKINSSGIEFLNLVCKNKLPQKYAFFQTQKPLLKKTSNA